MHAADACELSAGKARWAIAPRWHTGTQDRGNSPTMMTDIQALDLV